MCKKSTLILALCLFSLIFKSNAQEKEAVEKKIYTTSRVTTQPPTIDGHFDDPIWESVEWGGDFTQFKPDTGKLPSQATAFKILYDDKNLYVLSEW